MSGDPHGRATAVFVATLVAVLAVVAVVSVAVVREPTPPDSRTTPVAPAAVVAPRARSVPVAQAVGSLAVLRDWDRSRAAAWASGDVAALRRLYVRGSAAGRRDVAMLRAWRGRGLRVERMSVQVLAVELRVRSERRIVLVVTDRLAGAVAVAVTGASRDLPHDRATTRRLEFRSVGGRWLLASAQEVVREAPGQARSPVASTASTSGSANS
ncbi:hypothetical protein [Nocardioides vastitatis]|uniref:SnoaL-like domain-containing protein n=1 Tax=Nocardioides vastitatis TaxID=2568655 RepID=A0ABW0ZGX4_9ACTN